MLAFEDLAEVVGQLGMSLCDCFDETIAWVMKQKEAADRVADAADEGLNPDVADTLYDDVLGYAQIVRLLEVGREMCR